MSLCHSDFVREYPAVKHTDRDCEIPALMEFIKAHAPIDSLLDVGCHYSASEGYYAPMIRPMVKCYHGIDIIDYPEGEKVLDKLYKGSVVDYPFDRLYDVVMCLSAIEHSGISTYKVKDYYQERVAVFTRLLQIAKKYVWLSFPVGLTYYIPDQFAIIDEYTLQKFELECKRLGWKYHERFFYTQGVNLGHPWYEHKKRDVALNILPMVFIGAQSICVMEIERRCEHVAF